MPACNRPDRAIPVPKGSRLPAGVTEAMFLSRRYRLELSDKVNAFVDKLDKAPVAELVADLRDTVQQADRLLASASVKQGVEGLREVKPLLESLKSTSEAARVALEQAGTTMRSAGATVGPDSALRYDLARLLKELTTTARSLRTLADFLEKNPNALILGKPSP